MFARACIYVAVCVSVYASLPQIASAAESDTDRAIAAHRMGQLNITAPAGTAIRVQQVRHEFWFGAAISSAPFSWQTDSADAATYKRVFLENFNAAVTENALKWHAMERRQGHVDYSVVDAILAWTEEHEIPLRGHNIFWGVSNRVQDWQKKMDDDELRETLKARALTIARRYRGRFAEYDLNNEMLHDNYYERRFGPQITKQMADWVREGDPQAVLYLNDYDILTGDRLDDYVTHIQNLLNMGVPIGGIGVQGHLHGESFDAVALKHALDTLAQFKLPIRVTEFNLPGQRSRFMSDRRLRLTADEEQARAKAIVAYYRICFAHPAVRGILMWGFWEGANWIPASSLYRRDWTPTPAARAYHDLVYRQWWTDWQGQTDAGGKCTVRAFFGRHRVTVAGKSKTVELTSAKGTAHVSFP